MSDSGFPPTSSPETDYADQSNFDLSEFEFFDEPLEDDPASMVSGSSSITISPARYIGNSSKSSSHQEETTSSSSKTIGRGEAKAKKEDTGKVAFKTKSEFEILDDGFKWRKYGKKTVKNSPYPRNYYKCSVEGCPVKKRVEKRWRRPKVCDYNL